MQINRLLNNDETMADASPSQAAAAPPPAKKGPGRGNWRRNRQKQEAVPLAVRGTENNQPVPLLPNSGAGSLGQDAGSSQGQPATPGSNPFTFSNGINQLSPHHSTNGTLQTHLNRDHVPTPSYQAQKRNRGMTQHQSAVVNYRKQQIDYTLDRRINKLHSGARYAREGEGAMLRAWKRIKLLPADYDSEEESVKLRKSKDKAEKDEDWKVHKGKENADSVDEFDAARRPKVFMAGMGRVNGQASDVGEEARSIAKSFRRASRRLERWEESNLPGRAMIRRRHLQSEHLSPPQRRSVTGTRAHHFAEDQPSARRSLPRQRSGLGRASEGRAVSGMSEDRRPRHDAEDEDGGGELDEEDRELLGEVDADESEEDDEDEEMADD